MFRLTPIERNILGTITTCADLEIPEIASLLGERVHVVRHAVTRLLERRIIRPMWVIDSFKLGWERYNMFFSLCLKGNSNRDKAINFISKHPAVGFFAESGADYDFEISIFGRDPTAPISVFDKATSDFGVSITSKVVSTRTLAAFFPRKYLSDSTKNVSSIKFQRQLHNEKIDALDIKLLKTISANPAASRREVAQKLGLPHATVDFRLRQLRASGVIAGKIYAVTNSLYGASSYLLLLFGRGFDAKLRKRIFDYAEKQPHCTHYFEGYGSWDYELGFEVPSFRELSQVKEEISKYFSSDLSAIKVIPRLSVLRYESLPPYEDS